MPSLRSLVLFSVIVLYDEMRKYITRNYPKSKFTQLTFLEASRESDADTHTHSH